MSGELQRRDFIKGTAAAGILASTGFSCKAEESGVDSARPLRIAYYTDIHSRVEWDTPKALLKVAEAINAQNPDMVLCGGDLITDGFQAGADSLEPRWDAYFELHKKIKAPVHTIIGNHDLVGAIPEDGTEPEQDPRRVFKEKMGLDKTYRIVKQHGYVFFLLDCFEVSGGDQKYRGYINEEQQAWIKKELAEIPEDQGIIILSHMPFLSTYYQAVYGATEAMPSNRIVENSKEVLKLFRGHSLLAVLQGHIHVNEHIQWKGIHFITGGAVCAKWWRGPWHGTEEGFGMLTLTGHQVTWEYIDYGWEEKRPEGV